MTATIFAIKRFAVHDGDGIRTTVFFKGCPLRCIWCHNPEGLSAALQLAFYAEKCTACGLCAEACPVGAHRIEDGQHSFNRARCTACGQCVEFCPARALTLYGESMTVNELLTVLLADRAYYANSGGGVTLSGGECLCQTAFCTALLRDLKRNGIHTAVDTCGFVPRSAIDAVSPYTDLFLYDLKAYADDVHRRWTGQSNTCILENLHYIDSLGCATEVRIPYVPGCNAGEIAALAGELTELRHLTRVRVLPYHNLAGAKYSALGLANTLPPDPPTAEAVADAVALLRRTGLRAD